MKRKIILFDSDRTRTIRLREILSSFGEVTSLHSYFELLEHRNYQDNDLFVSQTKVDGIDFEEVFSTIFEPLYLEHDPKFLLITSSRGKEHLYQKLFNISFEMMKLPAEDIEIKSRITRLLYPVHRNFSGQLGSMTLLECIQFLWSTKQTGRLTITNNSTYGKLFFEKGEILHIENSELSSSTSDDFQNICKSFLRQGTFHFHFQNKILCENTITKKTEHLLLESASTFDEFVGI